MDVALSGSLSLALSLSLSLSLSVCVCVCVRVCPFASVLTDGLLCVCVCACYAHSLHPLYSQQHLGLLYIFLCVLVCV